MLEDDAGNRAIRRRRQFASGLHEPGCCPLVKGLVAAQQVSGAGVGQVDGKARCVSGRVEDRQGERAGAVTAHAGSVARPCVHAAGKLGEPCFLLGIAHAHLGVVVAKGDGKGDLALHKGFADGGKRASDGIGAVSIPRVIALDLVPGQHYEVRTGAVEHGVQQGERLRAHAGGFLHVGNLQELE